MPQSSENIWDQHAQKAFFSLLKKQSKNDQGKAVLAKAEELVYHQDGVNHDLLKGAESLMNMHTLKYRNADNEQQAKELLGVLYNKLGEKEKANRFI